MTDKHSASRARALAAELRDLRRQAKLNTRDAADRIGISSASLNRSELGTRMPPPEEVSALMVAYAVTGVARERVLALARAANPAGWWETGGNALPKQLPTLITFESQATRITEFQPLVVPGLLQTHAYMRTLMQSGGIPDDEAEPRVAARAGRQTVLTRKNPPRYTTIMDEAVLRRPFGGRAVMAQQIRRIIELAELPNITVQVIPFDRGGYPIYGPFVLLQFAKALDIVHLEHKQASGFLDDPGDTAPFQPLTDTLKAAALGPAETSEFLAAVAADYDRK
ncbi:MAG TPA: helix-turn-helix transcriptional regulator [Actinophytocola sp.]|uniref:helix-turn-helix domain-containing protein n=1 Tax=Actinophytocola sp. TaxID=1872138 RepID=UPI002DDDA898|nr:helix-turn-helix transcriptional regulator [Actinophytocola sp.]HEV2779594.1 helix-turn-helix transcriptional regulator [Actinophytocola sp.]